VHVDCIWEAAIDDCLDQMQAIQHEATATRAYEATGTRAHVHSALIDRKTFFKWAEQNIEVGTPRMRHDSWRLLAHRCS
jgi:hypothetical protein